MAELPYGAATASGWERTGAGCGTMPEKIYYGTNSQMKAKRMTEIKPCPFCGGKAIIEHTHLCNRKRTRVVCQKCGVTNGYCGTESAAIKKWNRRADNG